MTPQAKIQRTLRLLILLTGRRWYSREEIKDRVGIESRSLYRYIKSLEEAGFMVERQTAAGKRSGYRLALDTPAAKQAHRLLHFSEEVAYSFGFAAPSPIGTVTATLTLRAANLLAEEYPLAQPHITVHPNAYHLSLPVADWRGIGRFVRGLAGEMYITGPA